jgi:hypothetical protein
MPHARSLSRRRGSVFALVAASLAAALTFSGLSLSAGQGSAHATEGEAEVGPQPSLVVAPDSPLLKSTDEEFRFGVLLKNPGKQPLAAGTVKLTIDNHRAERPEDLSAEFERDSLELGSIEAAATEGGKDQRLELVVTRDDFPLLFTREAGAYPIHAEFTSADPATQDAGVPALTASTAAVWNDVTTTGPLSVTLVVPLVLPSSVEALPNRDQLASAAPRLLQVLDAGEQRYATIAIDPRIIAGTRALGSNAPGAATTLLERLERSPDPKFLLQFADADPAVQAALGFEQLMQPLGFDHATVLGKFEPPTGETNAATGSDTAESDPGNGGADAAVGAVEAAGASTATGAQTDSNSSTAADTSMAGTETQVDPLTGVPTLESLLSLQNARPGAWPAGGEVDSATLALLQGAGLNSLVLDSSNVSGATTPRATLGDFDVLIADAPAGLAARTSINGATATERAAGSAELAARLALSAQGGAGGLVLALDRGALADIADPLRIFDTIDAMPWVQTVSERLQPTSTAVLRAGASTEERRELLRATVARSAQIDELAPLLAEPDYLTEYQRERLLGALGTRYAAPGVDFAAVDQQIKKRDSELLHGVAPLVSENTQLVGSLSNVPITLSNSLPFEAVVTLHATPTSAVISLKERDFEVRVPAVGSANVLVPVHSRVSSGDTALLLEVWDVKKDHSFASALHPLTLRTAIETALIWVLGSAAALLLGFGIWRSVRRRRKGAVAAHSDDTDPGAADAPPVDANEPSASEE